jgi:soluble lytic murein transglycosylase-like protein
VGSEDVGLLVAAGLLGFVFLTPNPGLAGVGQLPSGKAKYDLLRGWGTKPKAPPSIIDADINRAADKQGIPRSLIHALVKVESGKNPNAVSPVGAKGLSQLLDRTGREWHAKLNVGGRYNPFDHRQNVFIGAAYLRYLLDMYKGNKELALTAYNQGYGRVNNLLAKNKTNSLKGIIKDLGPDGRAYAHNVLGLASRMSG